MTRGRQPSFPRWAPPFAAWVSRPGHARGRQCAQTRFSGRTAASKRTLLIVTDGAIHTDRLDLLLLRADPLRALLAGDRDGASREQGLTLPPEFPCSPDDHFLTVQLQCAEGFPESRDWCVRAIVRRADGQVIGHAGFHGPPAAVGRAEIGYTVFAAYQGHGYATETARALVDWARCRGERTVFAAVSPANRPSLAVVHKLGFLQTGVQIDEIDGEELVFEIRLQGE